MAGNDTLRDFFDRHPGAMRAKLAEALKVSRTVVYYWQEGRVVPSAQRRRDIAAFSNGEVPVDCWGPLETESTVQPFDAPEPPADEEAPTSPQNEAPPKTGTVG